MWNNFEPSGHGDRPTNRMYELEYPTPMGLNAAAQGDYSANSAQGSQVKMPMVVALHGYADAGQAISQASTHLLQALDNQPVATFKVDELIDYRSRRPGVTIDNSKVVDHEELSLDLHLLTDTDGRPFLLLSGPEPDLKWQAFSDAVVELARRVNVDRVITLFSAPMTVPHTRPLVVSAHASDSDLMKDYHSWTSRMIIPGAAALEAEIALTKHGFDTIGFTAHVPHYIAASDYPEATHALLSAFADVADRSIPVRALEGDMERVQQQLAEQVEESHEIATVVGALERQYDAEVERLRRTKENNLLEPGQDIPTGDELGAEFEAFLQGVSGAEAGAADTGTDDGADSTNSTDSTDNTTDRGTDNPGETGPSGHEEHE